MVCCALLALLAGQFALAADQIRLLMGGAAGAAPAHACGAHRPPVIGPDIWGSLNRACLAGIVSFSLFAVLYLMWPGAADVAMDAICTSGGLVRRAVTGS